MVALTVGEQVEPQPFGTFGDFGDLSQMLVSSGSGDLHGACLLEVGLLSIPPGNDLPQSPDGLLTRPVKRNGCEHM